MHDHFFSSYSNLISILGNAGYKHWSKDLVIPWCVIVANSHITKCLITNIYLVFGLQEGK